MKRFPLLLLLLIAAAGCDTAVQPEAEPPQLIPPQAFTAEMDLFQQSPAGKAGIGTHFMAAVLRVWPVTPVLTTRLAIPATLTRAALRDDPTYQQGDWVWAATVPGAQRGLRFTLTGTPQGGHVDWTMRIAAAQQTASRRVAPASPLSSVASSDSAAADSAAARVAAVDSLAQAVAQTASAAATAPADTAFVLYTARTARDGTEGSWSLHARADSAQSPVLTATFEINKEGKKTLRFSVPPTASEHAGDSVVYVRDDTHRRLTWTQPTSGRTHVVEWRVDAHAGSITAANYNGGQRACWNDALQNVACAP